MKTKFKGHETFFFREGWLSKAFFQLYSLQNDSLFSSNNGIMKLGVGSNMVKSIKYWMTTCGLLEYKNKKYILTELGAKIAERDLYLEDIFSLWILHINLVRNYENATTWSMFFNQFNAEKFENKDVKLVLENILKQNDISFNEKSLDSDINVLLKMYSKDEEGMDPEENYSCPLNRLNLIKKNRNQYSKSTPNLNDIDELVVLYAILLMCENNKEKFISINDLENGNNSVSNLFHFNRILINEYLERLSSQSYIRVEKTAGLDMVYITTEMKSIDVVKKYFEREVV